MSPFALPPWMTAAAALGLENSPPFWDLGRVTTY
jgi:hypothetical protein